MRRAKAGEVRGAGCCWDWCVKESKAGTVWFVLDRCERGAFGSGRDCGGRHGEEGGDWSGLERPVLAGEVRQGSEGKDKVGRVEVRSAG